MEKCNSNSLFNAKNNSLVTNALKALTPEQRDYYKKLGEEMYGSVNFEDNKILNNLPPPLQESCAYIEEGIKSGLLPSDLDENEIIVLEEAYGKEWYKYFEYKKEDIPLKKEDIASLVTSDDVLSSLRNKIEDEINKRKDIKEIKKKTNTNISSRKKK